MRGIKPPRHLLCLNYTMWEASSSSHTKTYLKLSKTWRKLLNLDRFPFVCSGRPKRTGSVQFKRKGPRCAGGTFFPPQLSKFPRFCPPEREIWVALKHEQGHSVQNHSCVPSKNWLVTGQKEECSSTRLLSYNYFLAIQMFKLYLTWSPRSAIVTHASNPDSPLQR